MYIFILKNASFVEFVADGSERNSIDSSTVAPRTDCNDIFV